MKPYPKKEPQFGLLVVVLVALCAFSCGGGICGLGGLFTSPKDQVSSDFATRPLVDAKQLSPPPTASVATSPSPTSVAQPRNASPAPIPVSPEVSGEVEPGAHSALPLAAKNSGFAISKSALELEPGAALPASAAPALRTWKSRNGAFSTAANLVGYSGGKVRVKKFVQNEVVEVPIEQLSESDRTYVAEALRVDDQAKVIFGKVVSVADGDTLTVVDDENRQVTIRLEGIDSPEGGQAFGIAAKEALTSKVLGKSPWTEWRETDKYGRTLGHIYLDGRHINLEMVADGYAWHYKQYSGDPRLANAEVVARRKRLGLWNVENPPTPPWEFRHPQPLPAEAQGLLNPRVPTTAPLTERQPGVQPAAPTVARAGKATESITVYVTRTGEKYHRAGCRHLAKSSIPIDLTEAKERYSPCSVCRPP